MPSWCSDLRGQIRRGLTASEDTYKTKKAACQARAKTMKFGVHFVKKNRWVKDCMAGKHPALADYPPLAGS
jgi:hypothetical protein